MSAPTVRERLFVAAVMIAVPILYVVWQWVPYIFFYVFLPFLIFSAVFGGIWTFVCQFDEPDYSRLGLIVPVTVGAIILLVGFPHEPPFIAPMRIQIEAPWLYHAFNGTNEWFQSCLVAITPSPLDKWFAPTVPYQNVVYDLKQAAWIVWASFLVGGPLTFFVLYQQQKTKVMSALEKDYQRKLDAQEQRVRAAESNARHANDNLKDENLSIKAERNALQREYEKLKALVEFQKKGEPKEQAPKSEEERPKGIFDSDLL